MKQTRYEYLEEITSLTKPNSIIEIGVATGRNAAAMIKASSVIMVKYTGYDVFDTKDQSFHDEVGNAKNVLSKKQIYDKLKLLTPNINLVEGMTQDTLWPNGDTADLVWLDGDHRIESIEKDYEAVKDSKIIVFDDYYTTEMNGKFPRKDFGCYEIFKDRPDVLISPETVQWGNIRIAVVTKDPELHSKIKKLFGYNQ